KRASPFVTSMSMAVFTKAANAGLSSCRKETPASPQPHHFIWFMSRLLSSAPLTLEGNQPRPQRERAHFSTARNICHACAVAWSGNQLASDFDSENFADGAISPV